MSNYQVINQDVIKWAESYTGEPFHALLCDPPYHLTSVVKRFSKGEPEHTKTYRDMANRSTPIARLARGFCGQEWDGGDIAFKPETWAALGQHLYPGAFGMAFASSRGWHRMAVAIEDAGFIIHPVIMVYAFGSGFPKATRIDTQVDKLKRRDYVQAAIDLGLDVPGNSLHDWTKAEHAPSDKWWDKFKAVLSDEQWQAIERRVIGVDAGSGNSWYVKPDEYEITAPATDLAKIWASHRYGLQALKPALEPIIAFSKPLFDSKENLFYNEAKDLIIDTAYLFEDLWTRFAYNAEIISRAESEVNTALNNVLTSQKERNVNPSRVNVAAKSLQDDLVRSKKGPGSIAPKNARTSNLGKKSNANSAESASIKDSTSLNTTTTDIVAGNVTQQTTKPNDKETANIVASDSPQTGQIEIENIAQTNAATPPDADQCLRIPLETATDTNIAMAILRYNSARAKLDLSTIWLWKIIWGDLCELVNKSIIEMESSTITELRTLNCSLRSLTLECRGIISEKNSSDKLWSSATIVNSNFIGLLTSLKIQLPSALNVNKSSLTPIIVFQRPYEGRPVDNITKTGAGALNIDKGRIGTGDNLGRPQGTMPQPMDWGNQSLESETFYTEGHAGGRWPSNLLLHHNFDCQPGHCSEGCPVERLGEMSGESESNIRPPTPDNGKDNRGTWQMHPRTEASERGHNDSGTAARYFFQATWSHEILEQLMSADPVYYTAKSSRTERQAGLDKPNNHPTVKSLSLTKYLSSLLLPPDAYAPRRILIPFCGVGSEMAGAVLAGFEDVIGIEQSPAYCDIARARLTWWSQWPGWGQTDVDKILQAANDKEAEAGQISLFDLMEAA